MVKKDTIFPEFRSKDILGYEFSVADESVFIDGGDISSFVEYFKRLVDSIRKHLEAFLEDSTDHFFTIDIKNFFNVLEDELLDKLLDVFGDLIG